MHLIQMDYIVVNNKSNSHTNILIKPSLFTKERVFTNTSILCHLLSDNIDVVEEITGRVVRMHKDEVIKSIQFVGREKNKVLKKMAFKVFDTLGWNQYQFDVGFDYIQGTFYDRITEDSKFEFSSIIEEAFFTMTDRNGFYQFLRNYTEGNMKAKEHMTELLKDILYGVEFNEMMNKYYNDTCGVEEDNEEE
jgi:hypothetical protein